ncbi:putative hemolysin [Gammaproteobacteria bacterium]
MTEFFLIVLLIFLNGFLAMSELALVSARKVRLEAMSAAGRPGARTALFLAAHPGRLLSTVQTGITLVGILTGAISGATLADQAGEWLSQTLPGLGKWANTFAFSGVVAGVGYLSLVGELAPKQFALYNPEKIAVFVAWPMWLLSTAAAPMVWLLETSTYWVLWLFGKHEMRAQSLTEEEFRAFIAEGARAGVLKPAEKDMMVGVMRLADWRVRAFMTPRPDVEWLDIEDGPDIWRSKLRETHYSRLPVARKDLDELLGIVQAKDLLDQAMDGHPLDLKSVLCEAIVVHAATPALNVLEVLRSSPLHLAMVVDEYGSIQGIVTATDILQTITGALTKPDADHGPGITKLKDGSWSVDGDLPFEVARDFIGLQDIPSGDGAYTTIAGFALTQLDSIPAPKDQFFCAGHCFEIVKMDGRRIDTLSVTSVPKSATAVGARSERAVENNS